MLKNKGKLVANTSIYNLKVLPQITYSLGNRNIVHYVERPNTTVSRWSKLPLPAIGQTDSRAS